MRSCTACGAENPGEARFCVSCGALLQAACGRCGAELPGPVRFCPSCGAPVAEAAPAGEERKVVTVLFADVTGSTGLGERLDPERLKEVMGAYFAAMREEIEAEGGTVEKFIGDAVMAAFGVPAAHEDDPARALRAALRMQARLEDVNRRLRESHDVTLRVRIGVNTGEVLATTVPKPGEAMVTGDAVNVAAHLQAAAEPGRIVVSERTARAVRGFRFEDLGALDLKGKRERVAALVLIGGTPLASERGVPGLRAPMVGREQELALLQTLFARVAAESRPNLVTIYGEPGVGKSRLTWEFVRWAESEEAPPLVLRGRCLPYGEGMTYWPLAEILKGLGGVRDTDPPDTALEKIQSLGRELLSRDVAPSPEKATAALAFTVGLEDPSFSLGDLEPREVRRKTHSAWRSFFSALAAHAPVVTVVEDIHWADAALLDLLEELADRVVGPMLLLCPSRPELTERRPDWGGGRRNFSSIALEPLSEDEADRLISLLLTVEDLPASVHHRILERAEGNPFFLEEIVRHLIDEGRIVREGDRWRAQADIQDVVIPDTIQGVLAARIDLLAPWEKRALQGAAVVGRVFWPGPVRRLLGDGAALEETFARLEERELVLSRLTSSIAAEPEYIFKHVLTREVAYESLPRRERSGAHAAVASWIEETAGERTREFVELLAYHYEEAYRAAREDPRTDQALVGSLRERAFRSLLQASEEARRRFAVQKAVRLADRALALAATPLDRAEALEQAGIVAINDYRGDLAWRSLREAADLRAEHTPEDRVAIARVCARAAEVPTRWPGSMREVPPEDEVRRYVDLGFANVGERASEELVRLLTARAFGPFSFAPRRVTASEEFEEARAAGLQAAEIATRLGRLELASAALDGASSANITMGHYGTNMPLIERRIALAASIEDPWEIGDIFAMAAWGWAFVGEYRSSLELAEEGIRRAGTEAEGTHLHLLSWAALAEFHMGNWTRVVDEFLPRGEALLGDRADTPPYFTAHLFGTAAFILDARGDAAAEHRIDLISRMAVGRGTPSMIVSVWLAWILARHDRFDDAIEQLDAVAALPTKVAGPFVEQVRAVVLAEAGRWDDVTEFLAAARAYAAEAELRALPVHLDRLEGRAALAEGRRDEALPFLEAARARFERLGAPWDVACTDLSIAEAHLAAKRPDEARARLDAAVAVFEELRSLREIERSRELLARLGR